MIYITGGLVVGYRRSSPLIDKNNDFYYYTPSALVH